MPVHSISASVTDQARASANPPAAQSSTTAKVQKIALYTIAALVVVGAIGAAIFFTGGLASPMLFGAPGAIPVVVSALEVAGTAFLGLAPLPFALACGGLGFMLFSAIQMTSKYCFKNRTPNPLIAEAKTIIELGKTNLRLNKYKILGLSKRAKSKEICKAHQNLLEKFRKHTTTSSDDRKTIETACQTIKQAEKLCIQTRKKMIRTQRRQLQFKTA